MRLNGIGYQAARQNLINSGTRATDIEHRDRPQWCVYWGRHHLEDHETQFVSRGKIKFGRAKFTTALQRGRNQGGADFRIYAEIRLESDAATRDFETYIGQMMMHLREPGDQGQEELFNIFDSDLKQMVLDTAHVMERRTHHYIREILLYETEKPHVLDLARNPIKSPINVNLLEGILEFNVATNA